MTIIEKGLIKSI